MSLWLRRWSGVYPAFFPIGRCPPACRRRGGHPRPPTPQRWSGDAAVATAIAVMGTPVDAAVKAMAALAAGRGGLGAAHPSGGRAASGGQPPRRPPHCRRRRLRRPHGIGGCVSDGGRCRWRQTVRARAPPLRASRPRPPPPQPPALSPAPRPQLQPAAACGRASCVRSFTAHRRVSGSRGNNAASGGRRRPHWPHAGVAETDATTRTAAHPVPTGPPVWKLKMDVPYRAPKARFWPTTAETRHHGHSRPCPPAPTTLKTPHLPSRTFLPTIVFPQTIWTMKTPPPPQFYRKMRTAPAHVPIVKEAPGDVLQRRRVVHHAPSCVAGWAMHTWSRPSARPQHRHAPLYSPNVASMFWHLLDRRFKVPKKSCNSDGSKDHKNARKHGGNSCMRYSLLASATLRQTCCAASRDVCSPGHHRPPHRPQSHPSHRAQSESGWSLQHSRSWLRGRPHRRDDQRPVQRRRRRPWRIKRPPRSAGA